MKKEQRGTIEYHRVIRDKAREILEQLDGYSLSEIEDVFKHIKDFAENIKLNTKTE